MDPNIQEPTAEVRQVTLFSSPLAKIYELQDAIKEDKKMLKEMESDFPIELEELMLQLKNLQAQVKEQKDEFLDDLVHDEIYMGIKGRILNGSVILTEMLEAFKADAIAETLSFGSIDQTFEINGSIVRLQTQKLEKVEVALDGKEI